MVLIPAPPDLKPTIIQMQSSSSENNEEAIDNSHRLQSTDSSNNNGAPKKRRRRSSSSLVSQSEVEKRRREHKTAHSIIEKKRRIRMNREFEALKYLIPACRNNLVSGSSSNNGEGMYKLTILQATVDYIKYLHQVINIQNNGLKKFKSDIETDEDDAVLHFASIDLDTEKYRNVDNEFDFNKLLEEYSSKSSTTQIQPREITRQAEPLRKTPNNEFNFKFQTLPSPIITPELHPRTSSSNSTNSNSSISLGLKNDFQFPTITNSTISSSSVPPNSYNSLLDAQSRSFSISSTQMNLSKLGIINESQRILSRINNYVPTKSSNQIDRSDSTSSEPFINLSGQEPEQGVDTDSANVLLSMKKDVGSVSSIQSLLN